jgi:hypothetical protein
MSTADLVMWVIVAALFPLWSTVIALIVVFPFAFIYHIWVTWFEVLCDLKRKFNKDE